MIAPSLISGRILLIAAVFQLSSAFAGLIYAQDELRIVSQQATVSITPVYQSWSIGDGSPFSEFSTGVALYYPLSRAASMSLRTSHAATGGDPASLSGLADIQLGGTYSLERYHVVLSMGVNLPSGIKEMSQEEFDSSILFSNTLFNFRIPNFGQGLTINPGAVWALPLNDNLVIGAGASYQYRGAFKPLKEYDDFDPGDEVLLTGGVDARLNETNTIAADCIVSFYGNDMLGSEVVFAAGTKFVAHVEWTRSFGTNELTLHALYRTLARDEVGVGAALIALDKSVIPDQFEILASYQFAVRRSLQIRLSAGGQFYQETPTALSGASLFGLGVDPEFTLSSAIHVPVHLRIQTGSVKGGDRLFGLDIGAGVRIGL